MMYHSGFVGGSKITIREGFMKRATLAVLVGMVLLLGMVGQRCWAQVCNSAGTVCHDDSYGVDYVS